MTLATTTKNTVIPQMIDFLYSSLNKMKILSFYLFLSILLSEYFDTVTMALLIGLAIIVGLLGLVIPKLAESIGGMITSIPGYMETIQSWIGILENKYSDVFALPDDIYSEVFTHLQQWLSTDLLPFMNVLLSNLTTIRSKEWNHICYSYNNTY